MDCCNQQIESYHHRIHIHLLTLSASNKRKDTAAPPNSGAAAKKGRQDRNGDAAITEGSANQGVGVSNSSNNVMLSREDDDFQDATEAMSSDFESLIVCYWKPVPQWWKVRGDWLLLLPRNLPPEYFFLRIPYIRNS